MYSLAMGMAYNKERDRNNFILDENKFVKEMNGNQTWHLEMERVIALMQIFITTHSHLAVINYLVILHGHNYINDDFLQDLCYVISNYYPLTSMHMKWAIHVYLYELSRMN